MEDEIKQNLVFLTKNLSNLTEVLAYLIQCDVISTAESEEIEAETTPTRKNYKLLSTLQRKDWQEIRNSFLEILRKTHNDRCAQEIQGLANELSLLHLAAPNEDLLPLQTRNSLLHPKINKKWWPEKKLLIKSLLKRKIGDDLLIEELQGRISRDESRMVVICESSAAAKYSGMGGVGKTLTAKWYAHTFEQEYDHIIWIDCGEGSLLNSFESLARDLEIPNRNELVKVQEYSRKCFDELTNFKCLWIYDNAENYRGEDGIINVLPKEEECFYCIITSRSREWGTENIGFGKISDLQLDIFSEHESLEFLNSTLNSEIEKTESQLKELCKLMGNLPLALQLAVAALNNGNIELQNYIDETSPKNLGLILDKKFDDYENTINKNIKISLDLILQQKSGKLAYEILLILGYIRPDDVRSIFLMKILNSDPSTLDEAINLLEKYALITKTGKVWEFPHEYGFLNKLLRKDELRIEMNLLSIHRLLQQVIRHNGHETEREILKKILRCVGFIDYKFIPFTKYADEKLQKKFSKVRAELLDQRQLKKLILEARFEESIELANFINKELKSKTTKFNYAVCLHKNRQEEECMNILKELHLGAKKKIKENPMTITLRKMLKYLTTIDIRIAIEKDLNLLDLTQKLTEKDTGSPLFFHYLDLGKVDEALLIGQQIADGAHIMKLLREILRQNKFKESAQMAKIIAEELKTQTAKFNYAICLDKKKQLEESLAILKELKIEETKEKIPYNNNSLAMGVLNLEDELSGDLIDIHLLIIEWRIEKRETVGALSSMIQKFGINYSKESLKILILAIQRNLNSNYSLACYTDRSKFGGQIVGGTIQLELGKESSEIKLVDCSLDMSSVGRFSSELLKLDRVQFTKNGRTMNEVIVNKFLELNKINELSLSGGKKTKMYIDLTDDNSLKYLQLCWNVSVLNWKAAKWEIQTLELRNAPFVEKTKMKFKNLKMVSSSLDISCLPQTIEKINLMFTNVFCKEPFDLPNLKYLALEWMDISFLMPSFRSDSLTHIYFNKIKEVNVDQLPESVTHVKIDNHKFPTTTFVGGVARVEKLILKSFLPNEVEKMLGHFNTEILVIEGDYEFKPKQVIELTKMQVKTIAFGKLKWEREDFTLLGRNFDRSANHYLWEGGNLMEIEVKEFDELSEAFTFKSDDTLGWTKAKAVLPVYSFS